VFCYFILEHMARLYFETDRLPRALLVPLRCVSCCWTISAVVCYAAHVINTTLVLTGLHTLVLTGLQTRVLTGLHTLVLTGLHTLVLTGLHTGFDRPSHTGLDRPSHTGFDRPSHIFFNLSREISEAT